MFVGCLVFDSAARAAADDAHPSLTRPQHHHFQTKNKQALYVVNAHLEGSPRKPAERLAQARSALAAMARQQEEAGLPPEACSVVFVGDLNSGAGEAVWRLLLQGSLPAG